MIIGGLQKLSMVDYPGKMCATVFLYGCNLRCPFCHNAPLVVNDICPEYSEKDILSYLEKRSNMLSAVCITGGEPTLNIDLLSFLEKVKALGYKIKLDTNGTKPIMLDHIISAKLCDYIAMDIKNCPDKYNTTCGVSVKLDNIEKSIRLIKYSGMDYEFRTTLCTPLHTKEDVLQIANWLSGATNYVLQQYSSDGEQIASEGFSRFDKSVLKEIMPELKQHFGNVITRGF